jgi:hypothetical protein
MPDLADNPLWDTFDLFLDSALLRISSSHDDGDLLVDAMQSLTFLPGTDLKDSPFASQLVHISAALAMPNLAGAACDVLAEFLDRGPSAAEQALKLSIHKHLFESFARGNTAESCLLCIAKFICFMPPLHRSLSGVTPTFVSTLILPLLSSATKPLFLLVVADRLGGDDEALISQLEGKWVLILPLLSHHHSDVRLWALLFLSRFLKFVSDSHLAFNAVLACWDDPSPVVRIAAVYAIGRLGPKVPDVAVLGAARLRVRDLNVAVRLQLMVTLARFRGRDEVFETQKKDPEPVFESQSAVLS